MRVSEAAEKRNKVTCEKHDGRVLRFVNAKDGSLGCARCILDEPFKSQMDFVVEFKQEVAVELCGSVITMLEKVVSDIKLILSKAASGQHENAYQMRDAM